MFDLTATIFQSIIHNERNRFLSAHHLNPHEFKVFNYMAACGSQTGTMSRFRTT